jgi:outer membrane protein assembly factor BamB
MRICRIAPSVVATLLGGAVLVLLGSGTADAATVPAWPMAMHDQAHTATSVVVGPHTGTIVWTRDLGGNVTPSPVIGADGTIYLASNAGVLHALDAATGTDRWTFDGGGPFTGETDLSTSPLILPSGSILWPGPGHVLFELTSSGTEVWSHRFSGNLLSPVRVGSTVYVVSMSGTVSALRVGGPVPEVAWTLRIGDRSFGAPAVGHHGEVVTTVDRSVLAVGDRGTHGAVLWRHSLDSDIEVSPSLDSRGDVFVTTDRGAVDAFSPSGRPLWHEKVGVESYSSSSVSPHGLLYFGDNRGELHVLKSANGHQVAAHRLGTHGLWGGQAVDREGDVYTGTQSGAIYGIGPGGRQLFRVQASGPIDSYPALTGNGVLIVGDQSGTVYAIG